MQQMLSGILVIDKPENISSAAVVSRVKKITGVKKAGHTGTLDPFATGLMICCINQATKLSKFFLNSNKTYEGVLCLGVETDTQDITGSVIAENDNVVFSREELEAVFRKFTGSIKQIPPAYSALKHKGVPLYKLARKGRPVQKPPRDICIFRLVIKNINLPEIGFEVSCSSGTYIRTLAVDIGRSLGCGAHLKKLRRTESSYFNIQNALTLDKLEAVVKSGKLEKKIISMYEALPNFPYYIANKALTKKIIYGRPITLDDIGVQPQYISKGYIRVIDKQFRLLALLNYKKNSYTYNYCCVFIHNMDNTG